MAHPSATPGWTDANQRYLAAALGVIRARLEAMLEKKDKPELVRAAELELARTKRAMPSPPALDRLQETFALSPFERDLILLVAGVELYSAFGELCSTLLGDLHKPYATFGLALSVLGAPHWSALTPASPLRRWRLLEQPSGQSLTAAALRIDERLLGYMTGVDFVDERLSGFVDRLQTRAEIAASHRALLDRWADAWAADTPKRDWPIVQLIGPAPAEKRALARAAAEKLGLEVFAADATTLPTSANELDGLGRVWMREAMLRDAALLISAESIEGSDSARGSALRLIAERMSTPLIVTLRERRQLSDRSALSLDVNKPSSGEQIFLWRNALGAKAEIADGAIEDLVSSFDLGASEIQTAQLFADKATDKAGLKRELWRACRVQARPHLDELAQRIEAGAAWDDIVLPQQQREVLRDVVSHVRHRRLVYDTWNFAAKGQRGLGIGALFAGVSGTGKTMAAEVIASELELDLYRVDLSQVVSKYIGETEKNLRKIFDAAESGGVILLFDEADALFGKRSEVKDSHDRYANIEISYLLQRMESYRGLAILTTNMKDALDTAFLRRIRFVVQFPFPDLSQRAEIWRRAFPKETPTENLEIEKLAKLAVAGGNIRNVALYATFIAANEGTPVKMIHLHRAARVELAKLERAPTEAEIGSWR